MSRSARSKRQSYYDPPPIALQDVKLYDPPPDRAEGTGTDYELKGQFRQLFDRMEQLGDGIAHRIEVRGGIPHRVIIHLSAAARW